MRRRSKPLLIAPIIPLLGILGIWGINSFRGTRYLAVFGTVWSLLLAALTVYIVKQALAARRLQKGSR